MPVFSREQFTKEVIGIHEAITHADREENMDAYDEAMRAVDKLYDLLLNQFAVEMTEARTTGYREGFVFAAKRYMSIDNMYETLLR